MSAPARIGTCRSATALVRVNRGSTWITVGAARLGLHHPLETDRVALGHVRALDQDAVGVLQVLLEVGRAAAAEASPQTGDGGGVSYPGLVLDLDRAQRGEQLLDQVVLFVVQGRAAQAGEAQGAAGAVPVRPPPASRAGGRPGPGPRSCPSRYPGPGFPTRSRTGAGTCTWYWRAPAVVSCRLADPFGHSRPRLTGESGSPSIWMTLPSLTKTCCPQPTAQYGQTDLTTASAVVVRAWRARPLLAAAPSPRRSVPVSWRRTGQRPARFPGSGRHPGRLLRFHGALVTSA